MIERMVERFGVVDGVPVVETSFDYDGFVYAVFNKLDNKNVVSYKEFLAVKKKFDSANQKRVDSELASALTASQELWDEKHASLLKDGLSEISIELLIGVRP